MLDIIESEVRVDLNMFMFAERDLKSFSVSCYLSLQLRVLCLTTTALPSLTILKGRTMLRLYLVMSCLACLSCLASSEGLEELEELLVAEYHNFTQLCNSTTNSTHNNGFLGGFSKCLCSQPGT